MPGFYGFPQEKMRLVSVPAAFFSELLPEIDDLNELKVTLYVFWYLDQMEGEFRYFRRQDLLVDEHFLAGLGKTKRARLKTLDDALDRALQRGTLLMVTLTEAEEAQQLYFLNSPKGRAAVEAIQQGRWRAGSTPQPPVTLEVDRPNIYRLYEQNIGPLTPMLAEMLRDAEATYAQEWIVAAFRIAVENNARNWRYIEAILRSWKEKGRDEQDRRDAEKARRRYDEGEFAEFIDN